MSSPCSCDFTKDEVKFLRSENQVLLVGADGSHGICKNGTWSSSTCRKLLHFMMLISHFLDDFKLK